MVQVIGYITFFALIFLVTGTLAALTWVWLERPRARNPGSSREGGEPPSILRSEVLSTISLLAPVLERFRLAAHLKAMLAEADLNWSVGRTVLGMSLAAVITLSLLWQVAWIPVAVVAGVALLASALPLFYVRHRRGARLRRIEDQLPEALEYLSRALVAGHSLPMSMELLAEETEPPLATEFRKTIDEYNLGMSLSDALANMTARVPSVDIQFFVSAIQAQSRSGGNLHELLEKLSETIRERGVLRGQIQALTANGRMTAVILSLLPFAVVASLLMVSPDYLMLLLNHPSGATLLFLAMCGQVLAYIVIRRIVDIKV